MTCHNVQKPRGCVRSCRVAPPSKFDPRSFRTVRSGKALVIIGCPRGKWRRGRCTVGTRAVRVDVPGTGCGR